MGSGPINSHCRAPLNMAVPLVQSSTLPQNFCAKHASKLTYSLFQSPPLCACRADNPRSMRRPALNASDKRGGPSHRLRFVYGGR